MGIGIGNWDWGFCDWGFGLEIGDWGSDLGSELGIGIAQWDYRLGLGFKMTIDIEY